MSQKVLLYEAIPDLYKKSFLDIYFIHDGMLLPDILLSELNISKRLTNSMLNSEYNSLKKIIQLTKKQICSIGSIGEKTYKTLIDWITNNIIVVDDSSFGLAFQKWYHIIKKEVFSVKVRNSETLLALELYNFAKFYKFSDSYDIDYGKDCFHSFFYETLS